MGKYDRQTKDASNRNIYGVLKNIFTKIKQQTIKPSRTIKVALLFYLLQYDVLVSGLVSHFIVLNRIFLIFIVAIFITLSNFILKGEKYALYSF